LPLYLADCRHHQGTLISGRTLFATHTIYSNTKKLNVMKKINHARHVVILAITIFVFASCQKEASKAPAAPAAPATTSSDEMVITPVGLMSKSNVHYIAPGYHLSVEGGRLQKLETKTGKMIEDFGVVKPVEERFNLINPNRFSDGRVPEAQGWIAYAYWSNPNTSKPITYFTTNWTVPSVPSNKGNQTIFLFNGMQDGLTSSSYIIQPVLQWGSSAAGGGKYWSITNWYVSGSSAYYGTLVNVSAGTSLQGVMQETSVSGSNYSYNSSFTGYSSASALQVNNVPQAYWAAETLESYGVTSPSTMYPPNTDVALTSIQILQGSTNASLSWSTAQATSGSAQKAVVISNSSPGGEVDIHFR
jgi:hypothetical protein